MKLKQQSLDQVLFRVHFDPSLHGTIYQQEKIIFENTSIRIFPLNVLFFINIFYKNNVSVKEIHLIYMLLLSG